MAKLRRPGRATLNATWRGQHETQPAEPSRTKWRKHPAAELRDARIHASQEEIAKSLEGNWRPELVFVLKQEVDMYDTYQQRIAECDQQLQKQLATFANNATPAQPPSPKGESKKKEKSLLKMLRRLISATNSSASREWT